MAKISERLLSTNILREKRRDSFDPQRVNLLGEDSICMVFVWLYGLVSVVKKQKFCFVK